MYRENEESFVLLCSICGEKAATFEIKKNSYQGIKSIEYSGNYTRSIAEEFTNKAYRFLKNNDISGLNYYLSKHNVIIGGVDVYCRKCQKVYCPECWEVRIRMEDGWWYDYALGNCPENHEKMIDD